MSVVIICSNEQYAASPSEPQLPLCERKSKRPKPKSKAQSKSKGKSKSRQKSITPTKTSGAPVPTLPLFDFVGYMREKDNRNFRLLIDQPQKCQLGGSERSGETRELYMLIAVKSVAADFDKRQVNQIMLIFIDFFVLPSVSASDSTNRRVPLLNRILLPTSFSANIFFGTI